MDELRVIFRYGICSFIHRLAKVGVVNLHVHVALCVCVEQVFKGLMIRDFLKKAIEIFEHL